MEKVDISQEMNHFKSTKGTEVYSSAVEGAPITTIYIKKGAVPSPAPKVIYLTIESEEE